MPTFTTDLYIDRIGRDVEATFTASGHREPADAYGPAEWVIDDLRLDDIFWDDKDGNRYTLNRRALMSLLGPSVVTEAESRVIDRAYEEIEAAA